MEYVLTTSGLSKSYGRFRALNDLSMHIPKGAIYGLVGKNGAGKTTLIRLICGLQKPTKGKYAIYGVKNTSRGITQSRRRMGAVVTGVFESQLPKMEKKEFHVTTQAMGETSAPVMITQAEYMRRMKDMAAIQGGMSFYGEMPDMYTVLLNEEHPLIKRVLENAESACAEKLQPLNAQTESLESRRKALYDARTGKKEEDVPQSEKDELFEIEKQITAAKSNKEGILAEYAAGDNTVKQLIDITLLQNNMLTGEALNNFVKRSIELMK